MHRTLTVVAVLAVLLTTAQLYAQNLPIDGPPWMPEPPKIWPPQPPIWPPRPPILPPRPVAVELKGYIIAGPVDWWDWWRVPGRTVYYFRTVDGQIYELGLRGAKLYLCGPLTDYVGTGKLVIVKGFLWPYPWPHPVRYRLFATEVRDPAYPHCN